MSVRRERRGDEAGRDRLVLEAAAEYIRASLGDDDRRMDAALEHVGPGELMSGLLEIVERAVTALADERGSGTDSVLSALISRP